MKFSSLLNNALLASNILLSTSFQSSTNGIGVKPTLSHRGNIQIRKPLHNNVYSSQSTKLQVSNNNFNLSKPTFDLFSLRSIRNDALLQYSSLNQSEPLRINLYLVLSISLFSFPTLSEAVIGEEAQLPAIAASILAGIGSVALFVNECNNRSKQLSRIEKELNAEFLKFKLSTMNKFEERMYAQQSTISLKGVRGNRRVLAVSGPTEKLKQVALELRVFRNRLAQAQTVVLIVPSDTEEEVVDIEELGVKNQELRSGQWCGQAQDVSQWKEYFTNLVSDSSKDLSKDGLIWFGLNYNGRSFASGSGDAPRLIELLGRNLRPVDLLDETDDAESTTGMKEAEVEVIESVLKSQAKFYKALTTGDLQSINSICNNNRVQEVTEILDAGGRIDDWRACLAEGARPAEMKTSGSDVLVVSDTLAFSTCIEFPADTGGYNDPFGATLLAMQRWTRDNDKEEWNLEFHQTIPWSSNTRAGGTLRCDCRGCVALTRGEEKRTFGGLIG